MQLRIGEGPPRNELLPYLLTVEIRPQIVRDVNVWAGLPVIVSSVEFIDFKEDKVPLLNPVLQLLGQEHVTDPEFPLTVRLEQPAQSLLTILRRRGCRASTQDVRKRATNSMRCEARDLHGD
jgi:hypothetical protein